jgi:hypothetical protein
MLCILNRRLSVLWDLLVKSPQRDWSLRLSRDPGNRPDPAGLLKRAAIGFDLSKRERIKRASVLSADLHIT